ncbi:MAG: LPS export ABC transporter permease LptF [Rhodobacteraceae bacterium]|nr:LPS export ABC transporter permease LptF [Paracoccaceae bacterium]
MDRFDRYLLSQLLIVFGFFSLFLVLVYWVNRAVRLFDRQIGDGHSTLVFLELSALTLPGIIRLALPVAGFVASVYVANRLIAESELVVVQATGSSPLRLARPVLMFGVVIMSMVLVLNHFLVPASRAELAQRDAELSQNISARLLTAGEFVHPSRDVTFYVRDITRQGEMLDIFLSSADSDGFQNTYTARRAYLVTRNDGPKLLMFEGALQTLDPETRQLTVSRFEDFAFDLSEVTGDASTVRRTYNHVSTIELLRADPQLAEDLRTTPGKLLAIGHQRTTAALVALIAPMLGFLSLLTGRFSRFGLWRQIAMATGLIVMINLVDTVVLSVVEATPALWPMAYVTPLFGAACVPGLIWWASRANRASRRAGRQQTGVPAT